MKLHFIIITMLILTMQSYSFNHRFIMARYGQIDEPIYNANEFSNVSISSVCDSKDKICLWKCCQSDKSILRLGGTCQRTKKRRAFNITIYDASLKRSGKTFKSVFKLVHGITSDQLFQKNALPVVAFFAKPYLTEDGTLYLKMANTFHRRLPVKINRYCVGMRMTSGGVKPMFRVEILPNFGDVYNFKKIFKEVYALSTSIFFLLLTILPYSLFPQLKDIDGSILIVHIAMSITAMLIKAYAIVGRRTGYTFVFGGLIHYFFLVSQLCWTNIMFYRLRRPSNQAKGVLTNNKKIWIKYCAYAIGLPLSLMIFVDATELLDMSALPWFITPQLRSNYCNNGMESLLYLYVPSVLLLAYNWIVCIINVVEFWRKPKPFTEIKIGNNCVKSPLRRKAQYVKLLVLLSICCIVNVLSIIYPESNIRGDTTFYFTLCFGPVVFITFVVDNDVLIMAKEYFTKFKGNYNLEKIWFKKCEDVVIETK